MPKAYQRTSSSVTTVRSTIGPRSNRRAYVSIIGDDFVEAVAVVVSDVEGELLIRRIEWGRP
jgi:hypothetical protein